MFVKPLLHALLCGIVNCWDTKNQCQMNILTAVPLPLTSWKVICTPPHLNLFYSLLFLLQHHQYSMWSQRITFLEVANQYHLGRCNAKVPWTIQNMYKIQTRGTDWVGGLDPVEETSTSLITFPGWSLLSQLPSILLPPPRNISPLLLSTYPHPTLLALTFLLLPLVKQVAKTTCFRVQSYPIFHCWWKHNAAALCKAGFFFKVLAKGLHQIHGNLLWARNLYNLNQQAKVRS